MTACQTPACPFRDNHVPPCLPAPRPEPAVDPDDARPAPEDRCQHCGGWGCFEYVDGGDNDVDVECGHCTGTGIRP